MKIAGPKHKILLAWLALMAATLLSTNMAGANTLAWVILLTAAAKIFLIFFYFMELNHAPRRYLLAAGAWLTVLSGIVIIPLF
ncbi:cytochrome C oxidase subunit IV family protein [Spongiibacter taiwanensis]|uniref:cytochrome C oxidase subunit IV family protein n=1 Tax=Spongiibacter taiwanensis TaxID=1748242 RepID=UPI0020350551|nr:cytochrome C oxidase subunit IV family protein [Spongiibacter taiwanensis]USA42608.1 cytochrome C oxidase subunit IV family protein [Spongiibacter taiwanensis]